MTEQIASGEAEGTILFAYALEEPTGPVAGEAMLQPLAAWRTILQRLDLIGQDPARYDGLGYGNLSMRDPARPTEFVITASQTSGATTLTDDGLVRIARSDLARFWVDAIGRQPPSSETMTHAIIYHADPRMNWVFHAHSPAIWRNAAALRLALTPAHVAYGTSAMAGAVAALLEQHPEGPLAFATLGHEDGVFTCGASAEQAGGLMVALLARVLT
jgi:L-ribulose-5-phosphate 4-epimerase